MSKYDNFLHFRKHKQKVTKVVPLVKMTENLRSMSPVWWLSRSCVQLMIRSHRFDTLQSGNILSWRLIMKYFLWSFSQDGQLSVSGERMCKSTGLPLRGQCLPGKSVVK